MSNTDTQQALENVLRNPAIWRAEQAHAKYPGISTAFPALDHALPDTGWPVGVLTELLVKETGAGELSLLMPALRAICAEERGIALLAPPYLPHARAWEAAGIPLARMLVVDSDGIDLLWATEQILRSGECGAVLVWGQAAGRALNHRALQRLHLAANAGNALCFLYRSVGAQEAPSPAPLRIRLAAHAGALHVHLLKCRGVMRSKPIRVDLFPAHWQPLPVQVSSAAPQVAVASHLHAVDPQPAFKPVSTAVAAHETINAEASSENVLTTIESGLNEADGVSPLPGVPDRNTTTDTSPESPLVPVAMHWEPADVEVSFEPAFVVAAPQWIAGGATNAPGALPLSGVSSFPAVHSRTSVA
jgi:protein ImuA